MYFDWTYLVLVLPALLLSLWASSRVNTAYTKHQKHFSARGITGAQAARSVLDANGLRQVQVVPVAGHLTDHYDPRTQVVRLSEGVYHSTSTAAIGIACHEVGHAIQHATGYAPLRLRNAIVPITNIGSRLAGPLILLGIMFSAASYFFVWMAYVGIACFALSTIFQLVTLPTEFNASARALASIREHHMLSETELAQTKEVLSAAAMTYVAALAVSVTQLLRLLLIVNRRRR